MAVTLSAIPRKEGKNAPGYRKLYFTHDKAVDIIPEATGMDVATAITMVLGEIFYDLGFDAEAGAFLTVEEPESEGSTGYNYTLQGFIAGDTAAIRAAIEALDGNPCIFIGEKKDGAMDIIGEIGRGIRLRFNKEDAGRSGSRVGYAFTGTLDYDHLPYTYSDGTVPTS
jgi:hypothetical protein